MNRDQYIEFLKSLIIPLVILPNNLLWHYTDTRGLESIVRNRTIRLSHPSFLNDPSELQYANSVYDEMLDTLAGSQNALEQEFVRGYQTYRDAYRKQYQGDEYSQIIFVTSFCEDRDRLELWRQYGDDGQGFSLGFRMKELGDAVDRQVKKMGIQGWVGVLKVIYDKNEQQELTTNILNFWFEAFQRNREKVYPLLKKTLDDFAPFFKHPCYANEQESRLILHGRDIDCGKIEFLARRGYFKPYIDFKIKDDRDDIFPLDTVMIGPTTPPMWSERSLRMFLDNQRLEDAKLKRSGLPIS